MRRLWMLVLLLGLVLLSGCGVTMKSEDMATIENNRQLAQSACLAARKDAEARRLDAIKGMTPDQIGMIMMADAMARQAEALSGKGDPCLHGMNAFEMEAAVARSRNETIGTLGGTALRVGGAVGGAFVAADAIKDVAKTSGDKIEAHDGSTVTLEKTTSNSDIKATTGDESGGVSVSGPATTGPDKHSETTTEMVAPETPTAQAATE